MEWFQLIAIAILSILWAISTYKWVRAEQKAERYFNSFIEMWDENTRLKEQFSHYQKDEWNYDVSKWLDKFENEVSK